jgi:uncharacterized membrane protein YczE
MTALQEDIRRIPRLLVGLITLAIGIYLTKISNLGLAPWGVFHDGLDHVTGLGFGVITQLVGLLVLILSFVLFRTKVGLGTFLNVALVGPIIELLERFQGQLDTVPIQIPVFIFGFVLMTFGRSLYISSELGQGPRDGLFVGIARTTRFQVKHIKPAIELTVLIIGTILGGRMFFGTLIIVLFSGYFVQGFFKLLRFDPKHARQHSIHEYFLKQESM